MTDCCRRLGKGAVCREVHLPQMEAAITPYTCFMNGQLALVKWRADPRNRNWSISRWSCVPAARMKAKV